MALTITAALLPADGLGIAHGPHRHEAQNVLGPSDSANLHVYNAFLYRVKAMVAVEKEQ